MDESNMSHYTSSIRAIKCVMYTKYYCYQMKQYEKLNSTWELRGCMDAEYSGDNSTQKIVTVYVVLINRVGIVWRS